MKKLVLPILAAMAAIFVITILTPATIMACVDNTIWVADNSPPTEASSLLLTTNSAIASTQTVPDATGAPTALAAYESYPNPALAVASGMYFSYPVNNRASPATASSTINDHSYLDGQTANTDYGPATQPEVLTTGFDWYANIGFTSNLTNSLAATSSMTATAIWRPDNDVRDRTAAIASAMACNTGLLNGSFVPGGTTV